jgi:pyruvate formate lyase activating enzyme
VETKKPVILRKTSLVDYPGLISAVMFFPGCNLRCPRCHNRELVLGSGGGYITLEKALASIEKRRPVLGGVVLSGGEPTLFAGLGAVMGRIKSLGLKVKLDTNGLLPEALEALFSAEETRPDYIAMDLKTSPERYGELLPENSRETAHPGEAVKRSAALIRASGIAHEFRSLVLPSKTALPGNTTLPEPYFGAEAQAALSPLAGNSPWHIRPFVPGNCLDPAWNNLKP